MSEDLCDGRDGCPNKPTTSYGGIRCCSACRSELARECARESARLKAEAERSIAAALEQSRAEAAANELREQSQRDARFGLSTAAAIVHPAPVATPRPPRPAPPPRPDKTAAILAELNAGATVAEVAEKLSAGRRNVAKIRDEAGIPAITAPRVPHSNRRDMRLRPDADAYPELCRADGCDREVRTRGVCGSCWGCLRSRPEELQNLIMLPPDPRFVAGESVMSQIEAAAIASPGIHLDQVASELGLITRSARKAVAALRRCRRLRAAQCEARDPEYFRLFPAKDAPTTHTRRRTANAPMVAVDKPPGICRIEGCKNTSAVRDLCTRCARTAQARGIMDQVGAPVAIYGQHDGSKASRVMAFVRDHPGCTLSEIAGGLTLSPPEVGYSVRDLRASGRIKPGTYKGSPDWGRIFPDHSHPETP